jgi:SulP family sulfate permease
MPSSFSLNRTILNEELGGKGRLSALLSAAICAVALGFGIEIIRLVPTPMVGGLLIFLGALATWNTVRRLPPRQSWADYLLAVAIALLIIFVGYIEGFVIGIVAACLTFAVSYSQVGIVKQRLSRATYASKVQYARSSAEVLASHGEAIQILRLQGYIFFGTANRLFELARRLVSDGRGELQTLILDCQLVTGIEASATMSFLKLRHLCDRHDVTLEICDVRPRIARILTAEGIVDPSGERRAYESLDDALEEAERDMLSRYPAKTRRPPSLEAWLAQEIGDRDAVAPVMAWLERQKFAIDDLLTRQGAPADEIFFIETGRVCVMVTDHEGAELRLRTMTSCTVLGEIGFFGERPRTATVRAETPTVAYRLTRAAYEAMRRDDPGAALTLQRLVINTLADRLDFTNAELAALDQ